MQLSLFDDIFSPPAIRPARSTPGSVERPPAHVATLPSLSFEPNGLSVEPKGRPHSRNDSKTLRETWLRVQRQWFPQRPDLAEYALSWSSRPQKRTLASCNLYCRRVIVARELNYTEHRVWLDPLLYHEMCHAYLNSRFHDRRFYALERRHPQIAPFDRWIAAGGWQRAVRSDRGKRAYQRRVRQA